MAPDPPVRDSPGPRSSRAFSDNPIGILPLRLRLLWLVIAFAVVAGLGLLGHLLGR